jgi:hypothetical protein
MFLLLKRYRRCESIPSFETEACFFPNSGRGQVAAPTFFPFTESRLQRTWRFAHGIKPGAGESSWIETIAGTKYLYQRLNYRYIQFTRGDI